MHTQSNYLMKDRHDHITIITHTITRAHTHGSTHL